MKSLQGFLVLSVSIACASAQLFGGGSRFGDFFGGSRAAGGGAGFAADQEAAGFDDSLAFADVANQDQFLSNGFVNFQDGRRTGVRAAQDSAARENVAARDQFGEQVAADQNIAVAESEDVKTFDEVDAAVGSSGHRKEALQVYSDQAFDKGEKISFSDGAQANAAVEAFSSDQLLASNQGGSEVFGNSAARSSDFVDEKAVRDDSVAAADSTKAAQNSRVQANDIASQRFGVRKNVFGEEVGGFDSFGGDFFNGGSNFFGKRRK